MGVGLGYLSVVPFFNFLSAMFGFENESFLLLIFFSDGVKL